MSDNAAAIAASSADAALIDSDALANAGALDLRIINQRIAVGTMVALLAAVASIALRPLWRDEYWSLFFSDPAVPLQGLVRSRMATDIHPPFYYIQLFALRFAGANALLARAVQLLSVISGMWLLLRWRRGDAATALYVLMLGGGYWAIFYVAELRPYIFDLLFVAASLAIAEDLLKPEAKPWLLAAFVSVALLGGFTDYFVALWMGLLAAIVSIALASDRRFYSAGIVLLGTALALVPTVLWIKFTLPIISGGGFIDHPKGAGAMLAGFNNGLIQTGRAVSKSLASNLAFTAAAALGARALLRKGDHFDVVLIATIIAVIVAALSINTLWAPILKERALIVLAPPLALLGARAVAGLSATTWSRRLAYAMPILAAITPLLFATEYFKDRENLSGVRKALTRAGACAGQPVLTLYPKSSLPQFAVGFTTGALAGFAGPGHGSVRLVDASILHNAPMPATTCQIKALVLGLTRGEKADHAEARAALRAAGVPIDALREIKLGGGRQRLFVSP